MPVLRLGFAVLCCVPGETASGLPHPSGHPVIPKILPPPGVIDVNKLNIADNMIGALRDRISLNKSFRAVAAYHNIGFLGRLKLASKAIAKLISGARRIIHLLDMSLGASKVDSQNSNRAALI